MDQNTRFSVTNDSEASERPPGWVIATVWTPERAASALAEARSWVGTRHVNRIAIRGQGIDCVQYVFAIYRSAGLLPAADLGTYSVDDGLFAKSSTMERVMVDCMHAEGMPPDSPLFGDIVLFKTGDRSAHCGLFAGMDVYHSLANQCVMASPWGLWRHKADRIVRMYAPGFRKPPQLSLKHYGR